MNNNNKMVYNTFVVYGQLVISMLLGLLAVRLVLRALGEESYGIYMLVGGVVAMLNVITTSLSNASMRFISNSLGKGDLSIAKKTFNTSINIHIIFALMLLLILEVGGFFMFEYFLNIPDGRVFEAQIVYQLMVAAAFITLVSVPYDAVINAHENLLLLSIIVILGQVCQLCLALYILYFCNDNHLIIYSLGLFFSQILQRLLKQLFCNKHYQECVLSLREGIDFSIMKPMLKFVGWDFFSTATSILVINLKNILVNMFFGVRLNAGQGIATNVNGYVNNLSRGITSAITPQMNKSEGDGDRNRLVNLTYIGVKYTTFMFALFAIPLMIENEFVITLWLGDVPSFAIIFCQLILLNQLVDKLTWQICNAIRSVGDIKLMTLLECMSNFLYIITVYLVLKTGKSPEWIYLTELVFISFNGMIRLTLAKRMLNICIVDYVKSTILPIIIPMILPVVIAYMLHTLLLPSLYRVVMVFGSFIITYILIFIFIGVNRSERQNIISLIFSLFK